MCNGIVTVIYTATYIVTAHVMQCLPFWESWVVARTGHFCQCSIALQNVGYVYTIFVDVP